MNHSQHPLIDKATALLDQEHALLTDGNFDALETLMSAKGLLAEEIAAHQSEFVEDDLHEIRKLSERNGAALEAAQMGVKSAIDKIAAVRRVDTHLDTYTASGTRQSHDVGTPRHNLKA